MNFYKLFLALALCTAISTAVQASQENTNKDTVDFKAFKSMQNLTAAMDERIKNAPEDEQLSVVYSKDGKSCRLHLSPHYLSHSMPIEQCKKFDRTGQK